MSRPLTLALAATLATTLAAGACPGDGAAGPGAGEGEGEGAGEGEGEGEGAGEGEGEGCTGGLDRSDIGTACAGADVDAPLGWATSDGSLTTDELPAGLALEAVDGAWRVRGTAPTTDVFLDATFTVDAELADGCSGSFPVGFVIDPCDGGDGTCGPFAAPHAIAGFCLPNAIAADAAFAVRTSTASCLSSSCSEVRPALCDVVVEGNTVTIGGDTCVRDRLFDGCSEDCGGGDGAPCEVPPLAAGEWVLASSGGSVTITVPFEADPTTGGACVFAQ